MLHLIFHRSLRRLTTLYLLFIVGPCWGQILQVRYPLDDKYADESDEIVERWIEAQLRQPCQNPEKLLSGNGGGPQGAEWNPSTDLIFFVYGLSDLDSVSMHINKDKIIPTTYFLDDKSACAVILPFEIWINALLPAQYIRSEWLEGGAFELRILSGDSELTYLFHAAFGE